MLSALYNTINCLAREVSSSLKTCSHDNGGLLPTLPGLGPSLASRPSRSSASPAGATAGLLVPWELPEGFGCWGCYISAEIFSARATLLSSRADRAESTDQALAAEAWGRDPKAEAESPAVLLKYFSLFSSHTSAVSCFPHCFRVRSSTGAGCSRAEHQGADVGPTFRKGILESDLKKCPNPSPHFKVPMVIRINLSDTA